MTVYSAVAVVILGVVFAASAWYALVAAVEFKSYRENGFKSQAGPTLGMGLAAIVSCSGQIGALFDSQSNIYFGLLLFGILAFWTSFVAVHAGTSPLHRDNIMLRAARRRLLVLHLLGTLTYLFTLS